MSAPAVDDPGLERPGAPGWGRLFSARNAALVTVTAAGFGRLVAVFVAVTVTVGAGMRRGRGTVAISAGEHGCQSTPGMIPLEYPGTHAGNRKS